MKNRYWIDGYHVFSALWDRGIKVSQEEAYGYAQKLSKGQVLHLTTWGIKMKPEGRGKFRVYSCKE